MLANDGEPWQGEVGSAGPQRAEINWQRAGFPCGLLGAGNWGGGGRTGVSGTYLDAGGGMSGKPNILTTESARGRSE